MDRMFSFVTETWNPLGGECPHKCVYCWARKLAKDKSMQKYQGQPKIYEREFKRKFKPNTCVFLQDMNDFLADDVDDLLVAKVFDRIKMFPETKFLLLTKNAPRYLRWAKMEYGFPENCVLGATIETNGWVERDSLQGFYNEKSISRAPSVEDRINAMIELTDMMLPNKTMVSIEPILDFNYGIFLGGLRLILPSFVAVGYDNYNHRLPEPSLEKTEKLIAELEKFTKVYRKTLRKAWYEEPSRDDVLTPEEVADVRESLKEIADGKCTAYSDADELIRDLRSDA